LTGLPPTPQEVEAFCNDTAAGAYERVVDRLLASPRYGERWARHWLDLVHFGETHGYDKDKLRPNAWPYRDYVITAFNFDKPYWRFVQEQLAGDVLYPEDPQGIVALGFIAAGPWDYVGHVELPITKTDGLIARYNDRDDMVMTTMSTFQSLTVHCARCHNHKFDPITQKDYYSLQAVFAGVDRANRAYDRDAAQHQRRRAFTAEKKALEEQKEHLQTTIAKLTSPELESLDQKLARAKAEFHPADMRKSPSNGYHSQLEPSADSEKWVQVDLGGPKKLEGIRLVPARPTDFPDTPGFGFPVRFKVEIANSPDFTNAQTVIDYTKTNFANPGDVPITLQMPETVGRCVRLTATRLWERKRDYALALAELQVFAGGTNVARGATVTAKDSIEGGLWGKAFLVDGYDSRAGLSDRFPAPEELAEQRDAEATFKRVRSERERALDGLIPLETKSELARVQGRLNEIMEKLAALTAPQFVYAAASDFASEGNFVPAHGVRPVYLLTRGDVKRPKEEMTPAALPIVPGADPNFELPDPSDEGARRAALANWITDRGNMLTRRSIVNRVWQYHFGHGIVDTPNDFGHMGALPTHPELLDWLAFWFLDHDESLKQLNRLIVTSATYRQSSADSPEAAKVDADNRFLWRMNRERLDAESLRDAMLWVSGRLDLRMGGPSDRQFFFKDDHSPVYDYTRFDPNSPEGQRRSIYRLIVRSVPDPFMDCLDAADPSQLVARRYTTLTALQALATLNNPFVLCQCEHFAQRLAQCSNDVDAQVKAACRLTWSRDPNGKEASRLAEYARQHGLANLCRVLFNSPEFVFVE
jgi:hypothetical protein